MIYTESSDQYQVSPAAITDVVFQDPAYPLDDSHSSCVSLNL